MYGGEWSPVCKVLLYSCMEGAVAVLCNLQLNTVHYEECGCAIITCGGPRIVVPFLFTSVLVEFFLEPLVIVITSLCFSPEFPFTA